MLQSARNAFLRMAKDFPKWMDIHKRPKTSVSGLLMQSVMDEQDSLMDALEKFKSDFFLISYLGREDDVLEKVYIAAVGKNPSIKLVNPELKLYYEGANDFLNNEHTALVQDGMLILRPEDVPDNYTAIYDVNGRQYSAELMVTTVWNIFDEYAAFSSLNRFEDETNAQLMQRCLRVFKNRTNSTEQGIKNAIINDISGYLPIGEEDISIEKPNQNNLSLEDDDFGTIYERLSAFNRDAFKNKRWDMDMWEHAFKQLDWVPHIWDKNISVYQDGTGQSGDLNVSIIDESINDTATVEVHGYKKSLATVNEYIRKKNLKKNITLSLEKYNDTLKYVDADYIVKASEPLEIDPHKTYIKAYKSFSGRTTIPLSQIITDPVDATVIHHGTIDTDDTYSIKIRGRDRYSDIIINKLNYISPNNDINNLMSPKDSFIEKDGSIIYDAGNIHVDDCSDCSYYKDVKSTSNGIELADKKTAGLFDIDVTGKVGQPYIISDEGIMHDISKSGFIDSSGFGYDKDSLSYTSDNDAMASSIDINIDCMSLSFNFLPPEESSMQGTAAVTITVDGTADPINSGTWASPRNYYAKFDHFANVHVHIQKMGTNPISFDGFKASRYKIETAFDHGVGMATPMGMIVPASDDKNTMHITMTAYDTTSPIIHYVHIGSPTDNVCYELNNLSLKKDGYLDIDTDSRVELYRNGNLIDDDFHTETSYVNNTDEPIRIPVEIDGIDSITSSSIPINKTAYLGNITSYITLQPSETLSEITIDGNSNILIGRYSLSDLLDIPSDWKLYAAQGIDGFIITDADKNNSKLSVIRRDKLPKDATHISYELATSGLITIYEYNDGTTHHDDDLNGLFASTWLSMRQDEEAMHVAYASAKLVKPVINNIKMPSAFSPAIDANKLYVYTISVGRADSDINIEACFEDNNKLSSWSLGNKACGITLKADFDKNNSSSYLVEQNQVSEYYTASAPISLPEYVIVDSEKQELARYIVTPPDGMEIQYGKKTCSQKFIAEEDGFNKLWYSNISSIDKIKTSSGVKIPAESYSLLNKEGIIVWNTADYNSNEISITYTYEYPENLVYSSIDSLYQMAGHTIEAYALMNHSPLIITDMHDGETKTISIDGQEPDMVTARSDNKRYQILIDKNKITAILANKDKTILMNTGYYYDDGKEYYYFNNMHVDTLSKHDNIATHNVDQYDDELHMSKGSDNFICNSDMRGDRKETICNIDFRNHPEIDGISMLHSYSACSDFGKWRRYGLDMSLERRNVDYKLCIKPLRDNGYAVMEITGRISDGDIISFVSTGNISAKVMKEITADGDSMVKSIFAETYKNLTVKNGYCQCIFSKPLDDCRYFLYISGEGTISDIIIKPYKKGEKAEDIHARQIDLLGFGVAEELPKSYIEKLHFDSSSNILDDLEITSDGIIRTGMNVDYGVTKVFDSRDSAKIEHDNDIIYRDGCYYTEGKAGSLITDIITLDNYGSVKAVYVKINDLVIPGFNNFNISLMSGNNREKLNETGVQHHGNLLSSYSSPGKYLQIAIGMPAHKVITNIEVYVRYAETADGLFISENNYGTLETKLFDTLAEANFRLHSIDGEAIHTDHMKFYIRGCREGDDSVWTKWYECKLTNDLMFSNTSHVFDKYHLFQFKIEIDRPDAQIKIRSINLEVV